MKTFLIFIGLIILCTIGALTYGYIKTNTSNQLIGGDKDSHGCLIAAGYSWCEAKQKCLRTWEETCDINTTEHDILALFAAKYKKPTSDIRIEFTDSDATHIRGNVSFAPFDGEGGLFLAVKDDNKWELIFDGNGSVDCQAIKLKFPMNMLEGICD